MEWWNGLVEGNDILTTFMLPLVGSYKMIREGRISIFEKRHVANCESE